MTRFMRSGAIALALLAGTGLSVAQEGTVGRGDPNASSESVDQDRKLQLTPAQKATIFTTSGAPARG